ncbi:MAG: 4-hydroxyphenylacetate 3-hydroxylase N-terminal domain-containing protein [Eubacteriales bacterium]|jgi:4-hydroxybutyryl-CoA dehydratase/vinylacetyl-CoA-Delta-isomerase|nr:4-hydroxyphenylacetate 3-hydroxylase N-terminal domain-containing protein [Eubacteriales bacterium]NLF47559.1 4-hydroxybutyryl-CoA dehydratase [Clostridiales bacterium]
MLMTGDQYIESLRKLGTRVYMFGEKIDNWIDHPMIRPSINCVKMTYDLAHDPQYVDLMTAKSNLTGETVNRFGHLHQSTDDLRKKVKMQRLCGQKTASCFQRCVGMDAFNAVFSTTFEIDKKCGTKYHENFVEYLKYVQNNDLIVDGAMTDPKGDRGLAPHAQKDPDLFLHIKEKREDGIVVRGAKCHQTGSINSHEHLIMPTQAMGEDDKAYAVAFACPSDVEGLYMVYGRQSCDTRKMEPNADVDLGNKNFGGQEALVVFDDVFIPNDRIFLCEEHEFAGMLVERFAGYHRQSYGGCKVGVGDVIIGAAALAADYNGANKASHIKDKLIEMTHLNETLYCCGIACSAEGYPTEAGNYQIDLLLANVCKQNVTRFPYEIVRLAEDIAGGLMVTMPSSIDFNSDLEVGRNGETLAEVCNKFYAASDTCTTIERMRILRFLENICLGSSAVGYRTESMHGAGSPQAQRIMIARQGNINAKKELAKEIAGIK